MMSGETQNTGGLSQTLEQQSKLPLYGATSEQLQELKDAQQKALEALEARYAQPNWFKVAAGFAKPQLGGFLASLGSASEALGENVEQQRAQQLPIAQMRAQLAQTNLLVNKNKEVNAKIESWKKDHPGQMPSAAQVMEWRAESPQNPTVLAIAEQQKLGTEQQGQTIQILDAQLKRGLITKDQYDFAISQLQGAAPLIGSSSKNVDATTPVSSAETKKSNNNNPGNIMFGDWAKANGATGAMPNGTAIFPDSKTGENAHHSLLLSDKYKDQPLSNIASIWAPLAPKGHEDDPKYKGNDPQKYTDQLQKLTGFDDKKMGTKYGDLSLSDQQKFRDAQYRIEHGVQPTQKTETESETPYLKLTPDQLADLNKRYEPQAQRSTYYDPLVTSDTHNRLTRLTDLLGSEGVRKGTGILYREQGVKAAIQKVLAQGASVTAGAGGLGANFSVALPVESALIANRLTSTEQQELREFQQLLSEEGRNDLAAAVRATGGNHATQSEFNVAMNSILSGSDPYSVLKKHIAVRALQNEREGKIYDALGDYLTNPKTADKPIAYFFHGKKSPYNRIIKEYQEQIQDARR
jgi:hypothetical protein